MLAPLAVFLAIMVITCTVILLICWVCDNDGTERETEPSRPAVLEVPVHPLKKRFPPVCATRSYRPEGRSRSVVIQRGTAQSLSSKWNSRRLGKINLPALYATDRLPKSAGVRFGPSGGLVVPLTRSGNLPTGERRAFCHRASDAIMAASRSRFPSQ